MAVSRVPLRKKNRKKEGGKQTRDNNEILFDDFTPRTFQSRNLKLIPSNVLKAIEYLLYMKPALALKRTDLPYSSSSVSAVTARPSAIQFKLATTKSIITVGDVKKGKGGDPWQSLTSLMGLGRKPALIFRHDVPKKIDASPSLYRIRSDPWPDKRGEVKSFRITIKETPTLVLLTIRSRSAIEGTEKGIEIRENNKAYWTRVKTYKKMYNVEAQTPSPTVAERWIGTLKNVRKSIVTQVGYSDIYDSFKSFDTEQIDLDKDSAPHSDTRKITLFYDLDDCKKGETYENDRDEYDEACKIVEIAQSHAFLQNSLNLFRSLDRNVNWRKQITFKKGSSVDPLSKKCPITYDMGHLWTLRFLKVWGMPVTCLSINHNNTDLVAVGHGMYFMDQPQHLGRVCIWNIKNCSVPEKQVELRDGVTSISFSINHPFILLTSLISGTILLIDISKPVAQVTATCVHESNSHHIWQVRWFIFDSGNEVPLACGDNGEVFILSKINFTKKIFLTLSRREGVVKGIPLPKTCRKPVFVTDKPSLTCMAANPDNCYVYLVGTDDGSVHLCSTDYWHEHTDMFQAHVGPVHHIKYHPDCSNIFLTVGIDYTVRIWAFGVFQPLVSLYETDFPIEDADWSPVNPNVVATVSSDRVSLWDISRKKLVSQESIGSPTGSRFTTVNFTSNGFNLICGDVSGDVHIYTLSHMPFLYFNKGLVLKRTFKRILLGKKDLYDKLKTVGYPFDTLNDVDI